MKQVHYIATLTIKRVEVEDAKNTTGNYHNTHLVPGRKVGDVVSLTVRAATMEKLKQDLKDHLLIANDDVNIPLTEEKPVAQHR